MALKICADEFTVTETDALPTSPPESLTDAVMRCVPGDSALTEKLRPVPMMPSMFDTQARPVEMSPASSIAVPLKVVGVPAASCAPDDGVVIVTCGALLLAGPDDAVTVTTT